MFPNHFSIDYHLYHGKVLDEEPIDGYQLIIDENTGQVFGIAHALPPGTRLHYSPSWKKIKGTNISIAQFVSLV